MRSASSEQTQSQLVRLCLLALSGAVLLAPGVGGPAGGSGEKGIRPPEASHRIPDAVLGAEGRRSLSAVAWQGGSLTASSGEPVRVYVSSTYPDAPALAQRWADFFVSLLHGAELGLVTAYVVPPSEIAGICGARALGCYGSDRLAFVGETFHGVPAEDVAAHEYGHHVGWNRLNPPWRAVDVGPKRWASTAQVCARAQEGLVFPGDQGANYTRNPGEGWAEVYRVLNQTRGGATSFVWDLVDPSFSPDHTALQAAEQDVVAPWTASSTRIFRGRFRASGKRIWNVSLKTPLDGVFSATLTIAKGAAYDLTVLAPGAGTPVAQGFWSSLTEKRATTTVCGQRSLVLRVTQRAGVGRFVLRVTHD